MKKIIVAVLLFISLISIQLPSNRAYAFTNTQPEACNEKQYQDIFCALLSSYVMDSVNGYYSKYLNAGVLVDPWAIEILSVERPNNNFEFVIKMQVIPYVGPHISIGLDHITITVGPTGDVKVNKYEHIESYYSVLPPHWQHIIKK